MSSVPADERDAIVLAYLGGRRDREIAAALGEPELAGRAGSEPACCASAAAPSTRRSEHGAAL